MLTVFRRLARVVGLDKAPTDPVKRILFIKLSEQGAMVLAYGAICRAVAMVGRENVFFCVFEKNREILDLLGVIPSENILTIRDGRFSWFLRDALRVLMRMRRLGIDTTIDLELFARVSAILSFLSGAKRRVGLHRFTGEGLYRGDLLTHRVQYSPYLHTSTASDLLVQAAERDPGEAPLAKCPLEQPSEPLPKYEPSDQEKAKLAGLLAPHGVELPKTPLVVLNPKTDDEMPIRKWPTERFVELGRRVLSNFGDVVVVVTGLPSEQQETERMCREMDSSRAVSLAGKLTLRELIALYTFSHVLVTSDSGPAHFASLAHIDTVVMFGPETPVLYGPLGDGVHVLFSDLACSPCLTAANHRLSPCRDNQCMKAISVERVYDKVRQCLEERPTNPVG